MATMKSIIVPIIVLELEALRIGPDERLIIRIPEERDEDVRSDSFMSDILEALAIVGLKDRALIFHGDFEFTVVKNEQ